MKRLVVDASVAAKWFVEESHSEAALAVFDEAQALHAPDFFLLEMDNLFGKWVRRGVLTPAEAGDFRDTLRRLPIAYHPFRPLLDPAWEIATRTGRSLYDCLYVALAGLLEGRMVTADRKLYEGLAGGPFEPQVAWVGEP